MCAVYFGAELIGVRRTWHALPSVPFLDVWIRWDSFYYLMIAADGYGVHDYGTANPFFPLYPMTIAVLGVALPVGVAALVIAYVSTVAAACLMYAWVKSVEGPELARRAVQLLILFPTSFFLTAAYSEALYLAASLGAMVAWTQRRHLSASVGVIAGCLARPVGVVALGLPFALQWLYANRKWREAPWFCLAVVVGGGLVLLIYWSSTGDAFAFGRSPQVEALGRLANQAERPNPFAVLWDEGWNQNLMRRLLNWSALGLVVAGSVHFVRRRRLDLALLTLLPVAVPLYFQRSPFDAASMARYALTSFPLFLFLARRLPDGRAGRAIDAGFLMFQLVLALNFATARWAE